MNPEMSTFFIPMDLPDMIFRSRDAGARFRDGAEVDDGSRIITLSTCLDTRPDGRYLVQGVLVNEKIL